MYVLVEVFSEIYRKTARMSRRLGCRLVPVPSVVLRRLCLYYLGWEPVVFVCAQVTASFQNDIGGGLQ